jgi:S-adenosylmethionine hydrolase
MRKPVSQVFHGRDIFTPAAAYLSKGVKIEEFGKEIAPKDLVNAPYEEAILKENEIHAKIISINKFGSLHLNITYKAWDKLNVKINEIIEMKVNDKSVKIPFATTFGDAEKGKPLIFKDDYGRIEVALNMDNFCKKYRVKIGDGCVIKRLEVKS